MRFFYFFFLIGFHELDDLFLFVVLVVHRHYPIEFVRSCGVDVRQHLSGDGLLFRRTLGAHGADDLGKKVICESENPKK